MFPFSLRKPRFFPFQREQMCGKMCGKEYNTTEDLRINFNMLEQIWACSACNNPLCVDICMCARVGECVCAWARQKENEKQIFNQRQTERRGGGGGGGWEGKKQAPEGLPCIPYAWLDPLCIYGTLIHISGVIHCVVCLRVGHWTYEWVMSHTRMSHGTGGYSVTN